MFPQKYQGHFSPLPSRLICLWQEFVSMFTDFRSRLEMSLNRICGLPARRFSLVDLLISPLRPNLLIYSGLRVFSFFPRSKFGASDQRTLALLSYFSKIKLNARHCSSSDGHNSCAPTSLLSCVPYSVPWSQVVIHVMHTVVMNQKGNGI